MGTVIGDLLPLAVGVAVSPVPIIAVILMLLAPRATAASVGFAVGWVIGIVVVTTITLAVASGADIDSASDSGPSTGAAWVELVLGVLLLAIAVKQWRGRPRPGEEAKLPKWMAAIDHFNAGKALGLGFLLSAINPKNLLMCVGAGIAVAGGGLDGGEQAVTIAVFTLLAASTVLVPVIGLPGRQGADAPPAGRAQGLAAGQQRDGDGGPGPGHRGDAGRQGHRRVVVVIIHPARVRHGPPEGSTLHRC